MASDILHLAAVVAVGWAVTFAMRALPFVVLGLVGAGRGDWSRKLAAKAEGFGTVVSPLVIFGLIVYSYSALEWRTAWPYLAGALTVGVQLWRRNPLVSIVAGTALYMALLNLGCASVPLEDWTDMRHPVVRVSNQGTLIGNEFLRPDRIVQRFLDRGVPKNRTVPIRLDADVTDLALAQLQMACFAKAGYRRPILVTEQVSESIEMTPEERERQRKFAEERMQRRLRQTRGRRTAPSVTPGSRQPGQRRVFGGTRR